MIEKRSWAFPTPKSRFRCEIIARQDVKKATRYTQKEFHSIIVRACLHSFFLYFNSSQILKFRVVGNDLICRDEKKSFHGATTRRYIR